MKSKFKSYSFWMSLTASIILVLNTLGETFGFTINETAINAIVNSVCGVLVVLGVITMPKNKDEVKREEVISEDESEVTEEGIQETEETKENNQKETEKDW